ncbi:hypothetical protein ZIOFF_011011 [Zingiber officinale]|uniref:SWIM-type domain-containing protein n=1 Tax=Zingiber officinale TaxID=94328 RepID=A0A8J5LKD9_ZINOF|nr:hypothetical protein ZIOFF_011011 [Zingiber officinale]
MEASNSTSDSESVETIKAAISEKDEDEGRIDKIQGCASGEDVVGKDSQITKEGQAGHNKRHNNIGDTSFIPQTNINSQMEPEVGMVFHSEDQAYHFYNIYAQRKGFSVRKGHLGRRKDGTVRNRVFLCSNEGARQKHSTHITKKAREVVRTNCMARIEFKVSRDGIWVVSKIIYEHNHPLVRPHKTHLLRSHRRLLAAQHDETGEQLEKPAQTLEFLIEDDHDAESIGFVLKDQSNTWLEDLYAARERWALVYHKNSFYAFMMTMQWSDNMKKHFKNHFNRKLPLQKFLEQYHKSLYRFREKELYEDYKSRQTKPVLLVDMPMLNEAAESYTRLLYNDFEEEFKSQLSCLCEPIGMDGIVYTFKVTLPEKHSFGIVELKPSDLSVSCSCRKFECRGILCMHALKVLNINNILHLPTQYILKRWSKYANVEILSEKHQVLTKSDSQDLLTMHYTRVCHKAITIAVKSAFSEDALQIFDQELDKLTTEVEHVLHMDLLNRQTEDNATIIENIQQDAFGGKKIRGRKKRVKDGQDTKYKKHQSHSESVNTGSFYQTLHTKDKARQTNDPSDHLMINETSHVPSYHPDSTTSYGNTMPLQPSGSPFPQETIMPTQEPFTPSQGLFDHQMASQGASSANITWCRRGSIGIPMQVMQGQSNNYMNWVIPHRNISNLNVPPIHLDPMQPTIPVQHHQNLSHKLTFDINKGTADTTGHMQH